MKKQYEDEQSEKELDYRKNQIRKLQENLYDIRRIAGWTMQELGDRVGVSKQTVSNWEKKPPIPMNFTQYIAVRAVLDCEIAENNNRVLGEVVSILLDSDDQIDEKTYAALQEKIAYVAAAAAGGITGAALVSNYLSVVGSVAGVAVVAGKLGLGLLLGPVGAIGGAVAGVASSLWLHKIFTKEKNTKKRK